MEKFHQLGAGERVPYKVDILDDGGKPLGLLPGDQIVIRASDPAVTVVPDADPLPETVASGFVVGGSVPTPEVTIQVTVVHADGTQHHAAYTVDVADPPPPAEVKPAKPVVRNLRIMLASQKKAAPAPAAIAPDAKEDKPKTMKAG